MKEDNGGWDTSDLEREIDAAVDRLFIEEDIADAPQTEVAQRIPDQQEVPEPDVRPPAPVANHTTPSGSQQTSHTRLLTSPSSMVKLTNSFPS